MPADDVGTFGQAHNPSTATPALATRIHRLLILIAALLMGGHEQ
jgi:hypothetical protein